MAGNFIGGAAQEKTIMISGVPVRLRADAATPYIYRMMFGAEIFRDVNRLTKSFNEKSEDGFNGAGMDVLERIAYCMAKQADPDVPEMAQWLSQFGMFGVYESMVDIIQMWGVNTQTSSVPKKKRVRRRGK